MCARENDLVDRTRVYAREVRKLLNRLPTVISNYEDARQVARSSGSVAANYLEAQEALSRKDFFFRIKVCRKEARETELWLDLLETQQVAELDEERSRLQREAEELVRIFSAIAKKADQPAD
jgi:four helix bundle protein